MVLVLSSLINPQRTELVSGVSIAYILGTIHFLSSKLGSFSDMEYYFYQLAYTGTW